MTPAAGGSSAASFLEYYLAPLAPFVADPHLTDLYVNRTREVWTETLGGMVTWYDGPALDEAHLWRLARQIAAASHQGVSRAGPLLSATLEDGSRVQVVAPPATRGGVAFAFRRHMAAQLTLADFTPPQPAAPAPPPIPQEQAGDAAAVLADAVDRRLNVVISGGTSSGKTTLLNTMLARVPHHQRIILIEDTPELRLNQPNALGLVAARGDQGEAQVSQEDLLQAALRMRPDRILLGELRGPEALTFLRAINTGHPGSIATLHADGAERALDQLALLSMQAGGGLNFGEARALAARMVDLIVHVERTHTSRAVVDIWRRQAA